MRRLFGTRHANGVVLSIPFMAGPVLETSVDDKRGFAYATGASFLRISTMVGGFAILLGQILIRVVPPRFDMRELKNNLYKMGVKSIPIVAVTALFTGAIMVIQAAPLISRFQAHGLIGWGAGFGTLREIGPLLTALMISGRVGANNAAELGTMVVTEQIDAMRTMAIDPINFLIAPRFVAVVITLFISTLVADALALLGAAYSCLPLLGIEPRVFYNGLTSGLLTFGDVAHGLIKSVFFGAMIGLSSCFFGTNVSGGAPGVGRAVNATVVVSAASIFVLDYFISFLGG
jgi:phospholipid/cholesterol/gamma-HCH transport system permease protein